MAKLTDEQNIAFVNDPRRVAAAEKVQGLVNHIQSSLRMDCANAEYYLKALPPLLNQLSEAWENLIVTEATVEAELRNQTRWHG